MKGLGFFSFGMLMFLALLITGASAVSANHGVPGVLPTENGPSLYLPLIHHGFPFPEVVEVQVQFDSYPDGTPITEDTLLSGDEFQAKGILLAGAPEGDYCSDATAAAILVPPHHVGFIDFTFLTSSYADETPGCHTVAVEITFVDPAREVDLVFAGSSSVYTLMAYDATGKLLGTAHRESIWGEGTFNIQYSSDQSNIRRITFGRETSITAVKELSYKKDKNKRQR